MVINYTYPIKALLLPKDEVYHKIVFLSLYRINNLDRFLGLYHGFIFSFFGGTLGNPSATLKTGA